MSSRKCKEAVSPALSHLKDMDKRLAEWAGNPITLAKPLLSNDTPPSALQTMTTTVAKVTDDRASAIEEVRRDYQNAHRRYAV